MASDIQPADTTDTTKRDAPDSEEAEAISVSFTLPRWVLSEAGLDPHSLDDEAREAKEAYLIDLYRKERITRDDLGDALGLGFHQTEQLLKDHGVGSDFTLEEFEAERAFLRDARVR